MRSLRNSAKDLATIAALAVSALLFAVQAQSTVTEQPDGSLAVIVEGERFVIPALLAGAVERAVREHTDDPAGLRDAIRAIVRENAANPAVAGLAAAIATLALFHAGSDSPSIAAILLGATQGNSAVAGESLIATVSGLGSEPGPGHEFEAQLVRIRATVENPSQVSPVQ